MNNNTSNRDRVQAIYEAFGRGDVPAILEHMSDDVDWDYGAAANEVPWLARRRGRAGVAKFFESLGGLSIQRFVPKALLSSENIVVALIDFEGTVKNTGKGIREEDEVHVWHFDASGKVARFRHVVDTAQHAAAYRG
jgi:uncharacterized protein